MYKSKNKGWEEDKDITFTDEDVEKIPDPKERNMNIDKSWSESAENKGVYDLTDNEVGLMSGEKVEIQTVIGHPVVITAVSFQPSQFYDGDYAKVSLDDGTFFTTSSSVLMDDLRTFTRRLPMRCMVMTKQGKRGKNYYYLAGSDHR